MKNRDIIHLPNLAQIERDAAAWLIRLDGDDVSEEDRAAFNAWVRQSQLHQDVLQRIAQVWGDMDVVEELFDRAAADDIVELLRDDKKIGQVRPRRRFLLGALAASIAVMVGSVLVDLNSRNDWNFINRYETAVGEQSSIELPDGTQMTLNTASVAEVRYDQGSRIVDLIRGEAYFNVAPNKNRPFSVVTKNGAVTAVGTAFSVKVSENMTELLVEEGRVALSAPKGLVPADKSAGNASLPIEVFAGYAARFAHEIESIEVVERGMIEHKLDWRDGMLSFRGETLEQVVTELGRYSDIKIEISDPKLKNQKIVAYYRIGDIETIFQALQIMAGIEVDYVDKHHVRLYRAN